eukprot:678536-Prorocentrum_minimum.AAC.1
MRYAPELQFPTRFPSARISQTVRSNSFVPASQELPLGAQEVRQAGGPMHLDARGDPGDVRGLPPGEVPLRVSARRLPDGRSQVAS